MSDDTSTLLVSPAEPKAVRMQLGEGVEVSALPERYGVDFLWRARGVWWGCQRKTVNDLLASMTDGRLVKEVGQMAGHVSLPLLIVEGQMQFTTTGQMVNQWGTRLDRKAWVGMQLTLASRGIAVLTTNSITGTVDTVRTYQAWSEKATHTSVTARPKTVEATWGKAGNRDWGVFMLQSFDGIGAGLAGDIYDHFGRVPLEWSVTKEELAAVKGLGPKRIEKMMEALP